MLCADDETCRFTSAGYAPDTIVHRGISSVAEVRSEHPVSQMHHGRILSTCNGHDANHDEQHSHDFAG